MAFGKRCSLCGGKLDSQLRCTECGLDNTKNDDMYHEMLNKNKCDGAPLTHVHEERENRAVRYTDNRKTVNPKQIRSASTEKKNANPASKVGKIIGVVIVLTWILPSVFGIIGSMLTRQQVESWLGENEIWSDSNDYIYEQYLEPGIYIVGEHVPEADYDIEIIAGTYGDLDIYEYNGSELSLKDFYYFDMEYDDQSCAEDVSLEAGDVLVISPGIEISIATGDDVSYELYMEDNSLTETYQLTSSAIAGVDFAAGLYDIYYEPDNEDEYGTVGFSIWSEENQRHIMLEELYFDSYMEIDCFRNVPLTEESMIWLNDLKSVTLVPSSEVPADLSGVFGQVL